MHLSSVRPLSPTAALGAQLEMSSLASRLSQVEAVLTDISILKASVVQLPRLQYETKHLKAVQWTLESELEQWVNSHVELKVCVTSLEVYIEGLVVENDTLKEYVKELEIRLHGLEDTANDASMSSVTVHSARPKSADGLDMEK
jgi:hypothetical protein